jgi:DNA polymerase IV
VRFADFRTITRSATVAPPIDGGRAIAGVAKRLLDAVDVSPGVRLLGVSVSGLSEGGGQLSLDDGGPGSWSAATGAVDAIRDRYGDDAIVPAALAGPSGVRVKRRGDQQWGPGEDAPER